MRRETRKFEQSYLRKRNQIEKRGIKMAQAAISEQYRQFIAQAKNLSPGQWKDIKVNSDPIQNFFNKFYPMSADLGLMTRKYMLQGKSDDEAYLSVFETRMQHLVKTKDYAKRIVSITNTTQERINSVLSDVLTEAELNGYGIDKIRQSLIQEFGNVIRGNVRARAQGIAQTEMISASNQASTYAADSTGLEYRKFWSTSHLQNIRPTHMMCEQESIRKEGLRPDERFESNGLLFPGDPAGSPEEVCNCRCTILHEIV